MPVTKTALEHAEEQYQKALAEKEQAFRSCEAAAKIVADLKAQRNEEAFKDPQPGDRFTEMYAFWLYVLDRNGVQVTVMYASAPCQFPEDGIVEKLPVSQFKERFDYTYLVDRGNNVSGWLTNR